MKTWHWLLIATGTAGIGVLGGYLVWGRKDCSCKQKQPEKKCDCQPVKITVDMPAPDDFIPIENTNIENNI